MVIKNSSGHLSLWVALGRIGWIQCWQSEGLYKYISIVSAHLQTHLNMFWNIKSNLASPIWICQVGNYLKVNSTAKVPPVPFQLRIFKGSKTFRLPRHFVEFLVHHEVARTYIDWSRKQISPEEQIIPTLARISSMKRTLNGSWLVEQDYAPFSGRLQLALWKHEKPLKAPCYGSWRNNVCVFSIRWPTL